MGAWSPDPAAAVSRVCQAPYPQLRQRQELSLGNPRGAGVLPLLLWQQFTEPLVGTLRGKKKRLCGEAAARLGTGSAPQGGVAPLARASPAAPADLRPITAGF